MSGFCFELFHMMGKTSFEKASSFQGHNMLSGTTIQQADFDVTIALCYVSQESSMHYSHQAQETVRQWGQSLSAAMGWFQRGY